MSESIVSIIIYFVVCIVFGLIFLSIHYYWKKEKGKGRELSPLAKQWMISSKPAAYLLFFLPIIIFPILWLTDKVGGFVGFLIIVGIPGALISIIKKG